MKKIIILFIVILITNGLVYSQMSVLEFNGKVQVRLFSKGEKVWKTPDKAMLLSDKDNIRTGVNSFLKLRSKSYDILIMGRSIVVIDKVYKPGDAQTELFISKGKVRIINNSLVKEENIIIRTKNSEITPGGTDFVIDYDGVNDTSVYVFDGRVKAVNPNNPGNPVEIDAYQMSKISGNSPPSVPKKIPQNILDDYNVAAKPVIIQPITPPTPVKKVESPKPKVKPKLTPPLPKKPKKKEPLKPVLKKSEPKPEPKPVEKPEPEKKPKPEPKPKPKKPKKKEPWCKDPKLEFNLNFNIMYMKFKERNSQIDTVSLIMLPELKWCRIGIGFYLPIFWKVKAYPYFGPEKSWYNYDEWDFSSPSDSSHDLWLKIIYISYGKKGDSLYIRIGGLPSVSFGNGFIMNRYSNMDNFPKVRKAGIQLDYIYNKMIGVETVVGDLNYIKNLRLYGGRFLFFPLWFDPNLGVLNKLEVGATMIHDKNLDLPLVQSKDHRVINWGFDLGLPLVQSKLLKVHYGLDWATYSVRSSLLPDRGWVSSENYGFATGFRGNLLLFIYRAEYRYLKEDYIPEYFDSFYDIQREEKFISLIEMYTNSSRESLNGYFVNIGFGVPGAGEIGIDFQEYYKDGKYVPPNKVIVYVTVKKGIIPRVHGTATYSKMNVVGLTGRRSLFGNLYDENTMLTFDGSIIVKPPVYIQLSYKKSFERDENGELQSYEIYSTGVGLGF